MKRLPINPRRNWQQKIEEQGLLFHQNYWSEENYYSFTDDEITLIEETTNDINGMLLKATQYVIDNKLYSLLGIPEIAVSLIESTWQYSAPSIYSRLDLVFTKQCELKLLECNSDTPTSLLEASVIQWQWLQDIFPQTDQFNSIHERLINKWEEIYKSVYNDTLYFTSLKDNIEDEVTTRYLQDTAAQAHFNTEYIKIEDIGWNENKRSFMDLQDRKMNAIFKLYPWDWLLSEDFGKNILRTDSMWIEPTWKLIPSSKGILPILWQLFPNHPNLLPASFENTYTEYVKKPLFGREGANVLIKTLEDNISTNGPYDKNGFVYQEFADIQDFNGNYPVIGSWIVNNESAGIGIRESKTLITDNMANFVPHLFI